MAIIKEKKIRIVSTIENLDENGLAVDEPEINESECAGFLKISEDEFVISYAEFTENGKIISDIIIMQDGIRVKRTGAVKSDMYFAEGKTDKSLYEVLPYAFDAEIYTRKIRNSITRDGGRIDLFYNMKIGGADKSVRMKIEC